MNAMAPEAKAPADFDPRMLAGFVRRGIASRGDLCARVWPLCGGGIGGRRHARHRGRKIGLAALAGVFIANLAIIGHDAIHNSFTRIRWLNRFIGTLAFLPALHPYSRWEFHHNKVHHRYVAQLGVDNAYRADDGRAV